LKNIYLYEPSIASNNTGDAIIVEGVKTALKELLDQHYVIEMPTHTPLSNRYALFLGNPDLKFVCGSNIITGSLDQLIHVKQWALNYATAWQLKNAIFIGVGAQKYQKCNLYTRVEYKKMFNRDYVHSVRDAYTERFLKNNGITNVINTGCPTMWGLTPEHCSQIPAGKADKVVLTLTDYSRNTERDEYLIATLLKKYDEVFFWVQGNKDFEYLSTLKGHEHIQLVPPSLEGYDHFLNADSVDFVGTRLHGGMRALQHKRRTVIIGIDNRALELHRDFNIPVLNQTDISQLPEIIDSNFTTEVKLNTNNIRKFLRQFDIEY